MSQQFIYQPITPEGLQALYNSPDIPPGITTLQQKLQEYSLTYDRLPMDKLELPYNFDKIQVKPNELVDARTIFNYINKLNENYIYIASRCTIESNILPFDYNGYFSTDVGVGVNYNPVYVNNLDTKPAVLPRDEDKSSSSYSLGHRPLSAIEDGDQLSNIVDGVWVRDDSEIQASNTNSEHYGFLLSPSTITVVKMSNIPDEHHSWSVQTAPNSYVDKLPGNEVKNSLKYTNLKRAKLDNSGNLIILDTGLTLPGAANLSDNSTRNVIHRYNINGYTSIRKQNSIEENRLIYIDTLGDMNTSTSTGDLITPTVFTFDNDNNIIIFDEHDYTFKKYNEKLSYIKRFPKRMDVHRGPQGTVKVYTPVVDMEYDKANKHIYVLTIDGRMIVYDDDFNIVNIQYIEKSTSNESSTITYEDINHPYYKNIGAGRPSLEQFKTIHFSPNESNIYYILTNRRVIKRYKTRTKDNVGSFKFIDNNIGTSASSPDIPTRILPTFMSILLEANIVTKQFIDSDNNIVYVLDVDRSYTYDQIYLYSDFLNISNIGASSNESIGLTGWKYILSFKEKNNRITIQQDNNIHIYDMTDLTGLQYKEYTSSIYYNKMLYKIVSNHNKLIKSLIHKFTSKHTSTGEIVFDKLSYLTEREHRELITFINNNNYIGMNEYVSTPVINRVFDQLYKIQKTILKTISMNYSNKYPHIEDNVSLEPYLYTNGGVYKDLDDKDYVGYYYIDEIGGETRILAGRNVFDGSYDNRKVPTTDRYLSLIDNSVTSV